MNRPLVIFGLKGTLIDRVHTSAAATITAEATCHVGNFRVWTRPHMMDLLRWTATKADVAIWSSATKRNTAPFVEAALAGVEPRFVWSREHAHADDYRRNHVVHEDDSWAVSMGLDIVAREFPEYPTRNILVVDDSCSKWRFFSERLVIVPTFDIKSSENENEKNVSATVRAHVEELAGQRCGAPLHFPGFVAC